MIKKYQDKSIKYIVTRIKIYQDIQLGKKTSNKNRDRKKNTKIQRKDQEELD